MKWDNRNVEGRVNWKDRLTDIAKLGIHAAAFRNIDDSCVAEVDELVRVVLASVVEEFVALVRHNSSSSLVGSCFQLDSLLIAVST